ncbi:MAG: hypothetical protein ACRYF5_13020, partial [Janthinobacterium lividum]
MKLSSQLPLASFFTKRRQGGDDQDDLAGAGVGGSGRGPIIPMTNQDMARASTAVASGSDVRPAGKPLANRSAGNESRIRNYFVKPKIPGNLPEKVSDGNYSIGRIGKQLFKTVSKTGADSIAVFSTPFLVRALARHYLTPAALNAPMVSIGAQTGLTSGGSTGGAYTIKFEDTLVGFTAVALTISMFNTQQKLLRGFLKNAAETGKHTTESAAVENLSNLLTYVLNDDNIKTMPGDMQKAAREAQTAMATDAGAIAHAKKFYDSSKLVAVADQKYNVGKASFVDKLPLRETPGWRDPARRLAMAETLVKMTNDYRYPMTRQKVRGNFFTHGCRSIEREVPEAMKLQQPFNLHDWEVPQDMRLPDDVDLHIWRDVPEKPNHLLFVLG